MRHRPRINYTSVRHSVRQCVSSDADASVATPTLPDTRRCTVQFYSVPATCSGPSRQNGAAIINKAHTMIQIVCIISTGKSVVRYRRPANKTEFVSVHLFEFGVNKSTEYVEKRICSKLVIRIYSYIRMCRDNYFSIFF